MSGENPGPRYGRLKRWPRLPAVGSYGEPDEVVCVKQERVQDGYLRLAQLGVRRGKDVYLLDVADVVRRVSSGSRFYVNRGGEIVYLRIGVSSAGHPYVETQDDASPLDNLNALPDCDQVKQQERPRQPLIPRNPLPLWLWLVPLLFLALSAIIVFTNLVPIQLHWDDPADIGYGTELSDLQLNATANVPGIFEYTPGQHAVLRAGGHQALVANFRADYLPSPVREFAITAGLLALLLTLALAVQAWLSRPVRSRRSRLPTFRRNRQYAEEVEERAPRPPRTGPALALLACLALLGGLVIYYLSYPRTASATAYLNVGQGRPVINWANPERIIYPTKLGDKQLNATSSVAGTLRYTPPLDTLLNAGGGQSLSVTLEPEDATDYERTSKTVQIDVAKGTPELTWQDAFNLLYGTLLGPDQFSARANVPGTITYSLSADKPLTVGPYDFTAFFHPTDADNWNDATRLARLTIGQVPLTLNWLAPPALTYPAALTNAQYNFTVLPAVPGTATLNPPIGTVLDAGRQQLAVQFQPADSVDFGAGTASAMVTVQPGTPAISWRDPASIAYPTPLGDAQLNATADVPGKFTYDPPAGTVLQPGADQPLTATFHPDSANYLTASATVHISVGETGGGQQPHQAQFLKNGDFEGGFTITAPATAVGTGWCHFNNGDYRFGYYDDAWPAVWYNPGHSQLIEIGAADYDPGDRPDRLSGICQAVAGLIPGQTYELTLHGVLRASSADAERAAGSYVAQWGVSGAAGSWQDVTAWQAVPWTRVDPYLAPGPVQTYVTRFTAPADRLTLFVGLLKKAGKGNVELNLNLDGLSLTGPTYDPGLTLNSR